MSVWIAEPLKRVGAIELGASRNDVRRTVGMEYEEFRKSPMSANTTDDFGSLHVYYDKDNRCVAVEIFSDLEIQVAGVTVFPASIEAAVKSIPALKQYGDGLLSVEQSVGIYAPGGKMESILFGVEGYYG